MLGAAMLAQAGIAALQLGLPALAPELRDRFDLSLAGVGLLIASGIVGNLVTLLAWGAAADRFGERRAIAAGMTGATVALLVAASADSVEVLAAALIGAGLFGASANAAGGRAVVAAFPHGRRGFALGLRHMATPLGGAAGAAVLPLLGSADDLAPAFLALAGGCALGAAGAAVVIRRGPFTAGAAGDSGAVASPLRDARIWKVSGGSALVVLAQVAILAFAAIYLVDEREWSVEAAAAFLAVLQLAGAVGRVLAGLISDRLGRPVAVLAALAAPTAVMFAVTALSLPIPGGPPVAALFVAGVVSMSGNGVSFAAVAELAGMRRTGTALGFQNTIIAAAVVISPPVFGALAGALSFRAAFALTALAPAAGWAVLRSVMPVAHRGPRTE